MQTFVNKFDIVINQDKSEVVLNFSQMSPVLPKEGGAMPTDITTEETPVSSMVMTNILAQNLITTMQRMLNTMEPQIPSK